MKAKPILLAFLFIFFLAASCHSSYHASKGKKGEACDCPKQHKVKKNKTHKIK